MDYLQHTDELGFSFKNRGVISIHQDQSEALMSRMKQMPEIADVVFSKDLSSIIHTTGRANWEFETWDDKTSDMGVLTFEYMWVTPEYIDFYDFHLIDGEKLAEDDPDSLVLINEYAVKALGWQNPVGKSFDKEPHRMTVKGVIKHVCNYAPTMPETPVYYQRFPRKLPAAAYDSGLRNILFKHHDGMRQAFNEKINLLKNDFSIGLSYDEDEYAGYLTSEKALIKLLTIVSAVCILICVFGFMSLVSLTCEERRKEIAIRKINGATTGDILAIFVKEYALLLIIGSAIAFTTGYFIMHQWIEHYVKQTTIPAWIFLSIFCAMALVIAACVGWQVYKASIANPAEVVKSV
jgi:hypothetical protein